MINPDVALGWVAEGQALIERAVMDLDDVRRPSRLPGWTCGHVITHVARNAEGLMRLLRWARTGIETPMYPSLEVRAADIEAGAGRPHAEQLDDLRRTGAAFGAAARELPAQCWQAMVATTRLGPIAASAIPWLRAREVWLHLVDLGGGIEIDVLPDDVATALVRDVAAALSPRVSARAEVLISGGEPVILGCGSGHPAPVSGSAQELAGWLTGRCAGSRLSAPDGLPELPSWL